MAVFERNLTSKILQDQSSIVISNKKKTISVLEVGCGDGNISINLSKLFPDNNYFASDISEEAIIKARSKNESVQFDIGSGIEIWLNQKFDLVICDISAISEKIANLSEWYHGVSCETGEDGLDIVKPIIKNVKNILKQDGVFIMPVISLCNAPLQIETLNNVFSSVEFSKKINWPLPKSLLIKMKKNSISLNSRFIYVERKFDMVIASTHAAICNV
jgi:methylase of polypeptide subunit release factors